MEVASLEKIDWRVGEIMIESMDFETGKWLGFVMVSTQSTEILVKKRLLWTEREEEHSCWRLTVSGGEKKKLHTCRCNRQLDTCFGWLSVILKIQNLQKELEVGGSWLKSDIAQKSSADTSRVLSDGRYQGEERIGAADRGEGEVAWWARWSRSASLMAGQPIWLRWYQQHWWWWWSTVRQRQRSESLLENKKMRMTGINVKNPPLSPITCVCDPRGHVYNCFPTDTKVTILDHHWLSFDIFLFHTNVPILVYHLP